jgi:hypothetical protein
MATIHFVSEMEKLDIIQETDLAIGLTCHKHNLKSQTSPRIDVHIILRGVISFLFTFIKTPLT